MSSVITELCGRKTGINDKGDWYGTRTFVGITDGRLTGFEPCADIPAIGDLYPGAPYPLFCVKVDAEEKEQLEGSNRWAWHVVCHYEPRGTNLDDTNQWHSHPLMRPPIHSWPNANQVEEYRFQDLDDKWFLNTAGDLHDPPPPFHVTNPIMSVRQNYATDFWDAQAIATYVNSINAASYRGAAPKYARIANVAVSEPMCENKVWYCEATLCIEFSGGRDWEYERVLNEGVRHKENGKLVYSKDSNGTYSTFTHLLDEDGGLLIDPDAAEGDLSDVEPIERAYRMRTCVDFTVLRI